MNDNSSSRHDPLEEARAALRRLPVPERPADAEVLARLGIRPEDPARPGVARSPSQRGNLMRLVGPSAAAVLLLIGGLGWLLFNGTASVALADVVKAAEKHKLVRLKQTQVTEVTDNALAPRGELTSTVYWDLKAPRSRSESRVPGSDQRGEQVLLDITDHAAGRKLMTNSLTKDGTLFLMNAKQMSFLEGLKKFQEKKETTSAREDLDGRAAVKYTLKTGRRTDTLWVDPDTKLPVRMEYEETDPTPNIALNKLTLTEFEWDPPLEGVKGPDQLFDTTPPKGYAIQRVDKTGEWK